MKYLRYVIAIVLAAAFAFFGFQKFTGPNPIFAEIAANSGIALFEPQVRMLVGAAEFAAAGLLIAGFFVAAARGLGALLALGVMIGAVGFHLSPWLGVVVDPDGAGPAEPTIALFGTAVVLFVLAIANLIMARGDDG